MARRCVVRFEESACVWKLQCPYCAWMLGFCLDLTDRSDVPNDAMFTIEGRRRMPKRFPKQEGGRVFAYFPVRTRKCMRCGAVSVRDSDLESWFEKRGIPGVDYEKISKILAVCDPEGVSARTCSDRVFDIQSEEWGVDGMPCEYLFVNNETAMLSLVQSTNPERLYRSRHTTAASD